MSWQCTMKQANNSLERTQPQRGFMYDVAVLRRSARGRWAAIAVSALQAAKRENHQSERRPYRPPS